ncbi:hypothetical protein PMAC_002288 [Pneumocystis sp. 'macacae']|nr:hypothetical protein PMAC_002288 [Pneumocystis sp. 'macacae']
MGLEQSLFHLKFAAKNLRRQSQKASRDELIEKANVKKVRESSYIAIQAGNYDIAKIYASTAVRKRSEALSLLRLSSKIDAVSSILHTAMTMRNVSGNLANVVKGMERAIKSMDLEQIASVMDKFESQFEDLDVQSSYIENTIGASTAMSTPQDEVDLLMQKIADEAGLELSEDLINATPSNWQEFVDELINWFAILEKTTFEKLFMSQLREERPNRSLPNPIAKTESAREALQSFFCKLCDKGYSRISEYENHLSSYEHNHRKAYLNRFREMKEMQRVSSNFEKQRKQGQRKKDSEMIPFLNNQWNENSDINIKPLKVCTNNEPSIRKVGFKKAFGNTDTVSADSFDLTVENSEKINDSFNSHQSTIKENLLVDSLDYSSKDDLYDPRVTTSP